MRHALNGTITRLEWQALQDSEREDYERDLACTGSLFGHFSVPSFRVTERLARLLSYVNGPVLDVGCGILPMPNYLKLCREPFGVDPYYGEGARAFPFAQAVGERLPFRDECFAGVALMSSLDHVQTPHRVLCEAWRVLRQGGRLFVWFISRNKPDKRHPWAFNTQELMDTLAFGFGGFIQNSYAGCREMGYPRTQILIGTRL